MQQGWPCEDGANAERCVPDCCPGAWELLIFPHYGLSHRWYVKAQSTASVTYVFADSLIQHQFVFWTWAR